MRRAKPFSRHGSLVLGVGFAFVLGLAAAVGLARAGEPKGDPDQEGPPQHITPDELLRRAVRGAEQAPIGPILTRPQTGAPGGVNWTFLGPQPITNEYWSGNADASGRVSAVIADPRNPARVYLAAAQGGVWKSTDTGVTWTPMGDGLSSLASGSIAFDPANPDVIYYGTGEQHYSGDSFYGDGLFRSADQAVTWSKIATTTEVGSYIARVLVQPGSTGVILVASDMGIVRSTDGGNSWAVALSGNWGNDLGIDPITPTNFYASVYGQGIYESTDSGATWALLSGGLPVSGFARINFAVGHAQPQNNVVLYAGFLTAEGNLYGMYKSVNGGVAWTQLPSTPNYPNGQGWYDNTVVIDPSSADASVCLAGGVFPYQLGYYGVVRTTDGGATWTDVTIGIDGSQVHPDQHFLSYGPDDRLWLGNDGGVWNSTDNGDHWTDCNHTLAITQFYTAGLHPSNPDFMLGGNQDNGTVRYDGNLAWPQLDSGDGGPCPVEVNSSNYYYSSYVLLDPLSKWYNGNYLGNYTGPWLGDRVSWANAPCFADPNGAHTILAGTHRVWRTTNGGSNWTAISGDLAAPDGYLLSLAVAHGASNTLYSGSSNGLVYVTTDAVTWNPRDNGIPAAAIPSICVDPSNWQTAYLCVTAPSGGRVYRTPNAGVTWTSITGDLPTGVRGMSLAVDFRVHPSRLYLGTDYGVYMSINGGVNWVKTAGIPSLAMFNLWIDVANSYLVAASHGRGMWRAPLDVTPPAVAVTSPVGGEIWNIGSDQNITWTATDPSGVDSVSIRLSRDGGISYPTIIAQGVSNTGTYPWIVAGPASTTCRVQVTAYDLAGNHGAGNSPANFTIADTTTVGVPLSAASGGTRLQVVNPFRPPAVIRYRLPQQRAVQVEILDPAGRCVAHLESGVHDAGSYQIEWKGQDDAGRNLPAGAYFCRMTVGGQTLVRRLALLR